MSKTFINARIFTGFFEAPYINNGYLTICGDEITEIGAMSDYQKKADYGIVEDLRGKIIVPGMVSTHYHFYGQFARGMAVSRPTVNWQQVLGNMWWIMDRALDEESLYYSTKVGLMESLKCGVTTFFDHNESPNFIDGSLDVIAKGVTEAGARAVLAYGVTDRNGKKGSRAGIYENERFIKQYKDVENSMIKGLFGIHASYSVDDDTLELCQASASSVGVGYHIHMAEDAADVYDSFRRCDHHVVERLNDYGILSDKTITAHNVHVGPDQWKIMAASGITAAHNVQSNTNNAVGTCPVVGMMDAGVHVALGGDGYAPDLYAELNFISEQQHLRAGTPATCSGKQLYELTYTNPSRMIGKSFGYNCGMLKEGYKADLVVLDYDPITPMTGNNAFSHIMCGASNHVQDVYVGGKELVRAGKLTTMDEEEICAKSREAAAKLWARMD